MSNILAGSVPSDMIGTASEFLRKYKAGVITDDHVRRFVNLDPTPFAVSAKTAKREIERSAARTQRKLSAVFKKRIVVDPIPSEFTDENLAYWAMFNMSPVFLPGEDITQDRVLKGITQRDYVKLNDFFYRNVASGAIKPIHPGLKPTMLRRGWYLADFTVSVDYTDGTQVFVNDLFAKIISDLRQQKLVGKHENTPMGSRFSITWDEWQNVVLTYLASKLNVTRAQMRLERAVEFNAIGNLYDANRGKFSVWEWSQDYFGGSSRLYGGCRDYGGLACVCYDWRDDRGGRIAGRPLVSFVQ